MPYNCCVLTHSENILSAQNALCFTDVASQQIDQFSKWCTNTALSHTAAASRRFGQFHAGVLEQWSVFSFHRGKVPKKLANVYRDCVNSFTVFHKIEAAQTLVACFSLVCYCLIVLKACVPTLFLIYCTVLSCVIVLSSSDCIKAFLLLLILLCVLLAFVFF